jgi:putative hydrolase of HD superfamily
VIDRALMTARVALALGRVNRATYHEDGQRPETDTDHTVMLCLLVADLAQLPSLRDRVDLGRLIAFALVHDVVEAYAGDTVSISLDAEQRSAKARRESAALKRLCEEFGWDSWLVRTIKAYEAMDTIEARLVNYADKIAPKLTHALNGGCTMRRLGIGVEPVSEQGQRLAARSPDLPELTKLFDAARAEMIKAYGLATAPTVEQIAAARAEEVEEARAETLAWRGMNGGGLDGWRCTGWSGRVPMWRLDIEGWRVLLVDVAWDIYNPDGWLLDSGTSPDGSLRGGMRAAVATLKARAGWPP